jgi:NTP pyrophosphatase (non-canonical NTP hydrolase)
VTLDELQAAQATFDKAHAGAVPFFEPVTPENVQSLEHLLVCITGEVGELANVVKKVRRGDRTLDEARAAIIDESADILIYVVKLANQLGFRLEEAFEAKLEQNRERFRHFEQ